MISFLELWVIYLKDTYLLYIDPHTHIGKLLDWSCMDMGVSATSWFINDIKGIFHIHSDVKKKLNQIKGHVC